MRSPLVVAAALAVLSLSSALASAQGMMGMHGSGHSDRWWHVGFGGGVSVPVSDAKDAFKNGSHGQGWVELCPRIIPITVRATFGYEKMDIKLPTLSGTPPTTPTTPSGSVLSGLGNVTFGFPVGPIKPYLLAGLGAFDVKSDDGNGGTTSKTQFGINGGAGVQIRLGQISMYIEGRMENIYTDKGVNSALTSTKEFNTQIIPVTFGISY